MIVVWRISQRCNLSCPFCAYDRREVRTRHEADVNVVRRFGASLADYQRESRDSVMVSWIGGEPFLFPALDGLTTYFTKELGLQVSATTNGTTLKSASVRAHVLDHYTELTISVDGIDSVHDELRGWPGGYEELRGAIHQISEAKRQNNHGPRLRANVVLMRQTIGDFERLCIELAEWGIEEITFNQLGGRDRPDFYPTHRLLPEQAVALAGDISRIRTRLATLGVRLNGSDIYLSRIQASSREETIPVMNCKPGEQLLFVNENGIAAPCNFTTQDYGVPISELITAGGLHHLPGHFARARRDRRSVSCEDCHSTQVFDKFVT